MTGKASGEWENGRTAEGVSVRIPQDPYTTPNPVVLVDDKRVEVLHVSRLRDGGTTMITTDRGVITCPRRIGSDDRTPRLRPLTDSAKRPCGAEGGRLR